MLFKAANNELLGKDNEYSSGYFNCKIHINHS